jgi:hypothetical protein
MNKKYKGMPSVCKPRGRNKPGKKKLVQRPSYPEGYATPLVVRYIEPEACNGEGDGAP